MPPQWRAKYFRPDQANPDHFQVIPELRNDAPFCVANLLDNDSLPSRIRLDIIFCRNVFIYLSKRPVRKSSTTFITVYTPKGIFFSAIRIHRYNFRPPLAFAGKINLPKKAGILMKLKTPRRVLVVDDSAFIRQYLKEILNQTEDLEVVATAADPLKAIQILKNGSGCHYPGCGDAQHGRAGFPPVSDEVPSLTGGYDQLLDARKQ